MISFDQREHKTFELVMQIRDSQGNPTGKFKTFETDDASKLSEFWLRNKGKPKRKKKKQAQKGEYIPSAHEAEKLLAVVNEETKEEYETRIRKVEKDE